MVVFETDFDLRFHEVGPGLNPPYNLSFLGSSHAPVFRIPEVGWRILVFNNPQEFLYVVAGKNPSARSRHRKQQEGICHILLKSMHLA